MFEFRASFIALTDIVSTFRSFEARSCHRETVSNDLAAVRKTWRSSTIDVRA